MRNHVAFGSHVRAAFHSAAIAGIAFLSIFPLTVLLSEDAHAADDMATYNAMKGKGVQRLFEICQVDLAAVNDMTSKDDPRYQCVMRWSAWLQGMNAWANALDPNSPEYAVLLTCSYATVDNGVPDIISAYQCYDAATK